MSDTVTDMGEIQGFITTEPIDENMVRRAVDSAEYGAVVVFSGVVRNHDEDLAVTSLEYHAHPDAEKFLIDCCTTILAETGVQVFACHRIGFLAIGDIALCAAAASAHRAEAFLACEKLVKLIKSTVPIWKRQHYVSGVSSWLGL